MKIETTPVREYCNRQYSTSTSHLDIDTAHGTRFQILRPTSDLDTNIAHEIRLPILRLISHLDINTAHRTRYQILRPISDLDTNTAHGTSFQIQQPISHLYSLAGVVSIFHTIHVQHLTRVEVLKPDSGNTHSRILRLLDELNRVVKFQFSCAHPFYQYFKVS